MQAEPHVERSNPCPKASVAGPDPGLSFRPAFPSAVTVKVGEDRSLRFIVQIDQVREKLRIGPIAAHGVPVRISHQCRDDFLGRRVLPFDRIHEVAVGLEVDPNGDTVPLDLSVDQLLAVGQLAAKLAEIQQTEYRDGLELARLALEHQNPNEPAPTGAGSTNTEGDTK